MFVALLSLATGSVSYTHLHPVPHDRVDDLQPLSCQRLERLAVRHAPLSAPSVVIDVYKRQVVVCTPDCSTDVVRLKVCLTF